MKKVLLLTAAFALATSVSFAQLSYGVKGGLNLSNVTNSDQDFLGQSIDASMKPSFNIGVFAEYKFNDFLAVSPELLFSSQGVIIKSGSNKTNERINYLNLPVLAKLYLLDNLSLDLGPQFGYRLNARMISEIDGQSSKNSATSRVKDFDISAAMGLTYNFNKCFVQARYTLGLNDIIKTLDSPKDYKQKNNVIQLGVGYRF